MQKKTLFRTQSTKLYSCGSNMEYNCSHRISAKCSKHKGFGKPKKETVHDENIKYEEQYVDPPFTKQQSLKAQQPTPASQPLDKESVIMRDIVASNAKYFIEKTKVCCSVKPSNLKLHLPGTTGNTVYNKDFTPKLFNSADKIQPLDAFRTSYPFFGQTNYNVNYVEHPLSGNVRRQGDKLDQDDAPRFMQTMYGNEFRNWGGKSATFKIEPQQNNVLGRGGKFNGKTVYNSEFIPKKSSTGTIMNAANSNPMFLNMNVPLTSNYRNEFTPKKADIENNYKPKDAYAPELSYKGAYDSEYNKMYDPKEHQHCHYRKIMSVKELQDLITRKA